jgi:hypothetical protein
MLEGNLGKIVSESFSGWFDNKKLLKYLGIIFGIYILFAILQAGIYLALEQNNTINVLIAIVGVLIALSLHIVSYWIYKETLQNEKIKTKNFELKILIKFILAPFLILIVALTSAFNTKFLLFIIGAIIFLTLGIFGFPIFAIFGTILIMLYGIVVIYNSLRLVITLPIFIESGKLIESLKKSWLKTKKNIINIIIIQIAIITIMSLIATIVLIPVTIYQLNLILTLSAKGVENIEAIVMTDIIYHLLILPSYIVIAYSTIVNVTVNTKIYKHLKK